MSKIHHKHLVIIVVLFLLSACSNSEGDSDKNIDPTDNIVPAVMLVAAFPNLTFTQPVALVQSPVDDERWYVVEQGGVIRTFVGAEAADSDVFIDISDRVASGGEAGLLNMVFHPDFAANGEAYLSYTGPGPVPGIPLTSYISRFASLDSGLSADPGSETIILSVDQPFTNHNGGWIAFGPDGYLFIGFGDGGSGGDPDGNGQNTQTLLGSILRIDVDLTKSGQQYAIPIDNPFFSSAGCDAGENCREIYAWGFRNPWRGSFDFQTGDLWIGDVGQADWEEIDRVIAGENYGWNILEGEHCFNAATCDTTGLTPPVVEYDHNEGGSVTGGYIYRDSDIPGLFGDLIYGDFISGRIWSLVDASQGGRLPKVLLDTGLNIASFAQDGNGEIYVVSYGDGRIYRLERVPGAG